MMAFTLVSLMLSLFGGIFAALSAFRNFTESGIRERCKMKDLQIDELREKSKNGHPKQQAIKSSCETAEGYGENITSCLRWWNRFQLLPTITFLSFAIFMAIWAINNWQHLTTHQDWIGWRIILATGIIVDVLALIGMFIAWLWLKHCSKNLDSHFKTVVGLSTEVQSS